MGSSKAVNGVGQLVPPHSLFPYRPVSAALAITPSVSVVIPALNEARNIPHVFATLPWWVDEVVLVDGHSTDDTVAVARGIRPDIKVVTQQGAGKGDALLAGFAACTGDIIVMIDGAVSAGGWGGGPERGSRGARRGWWMEETRGYEGPRLYGTSNLRAIRDGLRILKVILRERFGDRRRRAAALDPVPAESQWPLRPAVVAVRATDQDGTEPRPPARGPAGRTAPRTGQPAPAYHC